MRNRDEEKKYVVKQIATNVNAKFVFSQNAKIADVQLNVELIDALNSNDDNENEIEIESSIFQSNIFRRNISQKNTRLL